MSEISKRRLDMRLNIERDINFKITRMEVEY